MNDLTPFERELLDYIILRYGRGKFDITLVKDDFAKVMGCKREKTSLMLKGYISSRQLTEKAFNYFKENENGHE